MKSNINDNILILKTLKDYGYNLEKIEISKNSVGSIIIKDYSFKYFYNGIAVLSIIDHYNKIMKLDVLRPDYLLYETLIYNIA